MTPQHPRTLIARPIFSFFLVSIVVFGPFGGSAQVKLTAPQKNSQDSALALYRATADKVNDLVHTRLSVRFDYAKHYLYGKEWVSLKPHFYPTDSLLLDAKGMDIHEVALVEKGTRKKLSYRYDHQVLTINLGRIFTAREPYTVYLDYTAKPDELKQKGSAAITSSKGLYFINADGADRKKPIQVWTQGETESSSCWFPTIDKPNQKTTEEIAITVADRYTTLSNGRLDSQHKNPDGTRTDTWKMELPHAPYLFMMAVGDFKITHDHWKTKEVNYYLEPTYAPYAKQIFGATPAMMSYYAQITGVDFPWNKYAQIVVRDYVSGAMENTTATLHGAYVQKTSRELLDGNAESTICHELFHQWFGDYVTCESWSNITLNESFATLAEILWAGHSGGRDTEDAERYTKLHTYLSGTHDGDSPELVRFHYKDKEDVFDNVSYPKGSVILYALKNLVGDEAFFASLHEYLTKNAFRSAEAPQLRLAFEQVTGRDLTAYFNQWYYKKGHPILDISEQYTPGMLTLEVRQVQDSTLGTFSLPVKVGLYAHGKRTIKPIVIDQSVQTFHIASIDKPDFVDFDTDKILVGETREHKVLADYIFQYAQAPSYANRIEAVEFCLKNPTPSGAIDLLVNALHDPSASIREKVIDGLDLSNPSTAKTFEPLLVNLCSTEAKTKVQASALAALAKTGKKEFLPLFSKGFESPSYAVMGSSLRGLFALDPVAASEKVKGMDADTRDHLSGAVANYYAQNGLDSGNAFFQAIFKGGNQTRIFDVFRSYITYLARNQNPEITQNGTRAIVEVLGTIHNSQANSQVGGAFRSIAGQKTGKASALPTGPEKEALTKQAEILLKAASQLMAQ